jgi:hypothetical protein
VQVEGDDPEGRAQAEDGRGSRAASSGRNRSIPNTVPSDEARQRPLVVTAKKT